MSERLPSFVAPKEYDLTLTPDIRAKKFYGELTVTMDFKKPVKTFKMNQKGLDISPGSILQAHGNKMAVVGTNENHKDETVTFRFPSEVAKTDNAVFTMKFEGSLSEEQIGLYITPYLQDNGRYAQTMSTQFAATGARRMFPCFDEPKFKAKFGLTVLAESRFHVLSNFAPESEDNIMGNVTPPMRKWVFPAGPVICPSQIQIHIGEWDRVEATSKNGTKVRVFAPLSAGSLAFEVSDIAVAALNFLDEYTALPYPLAKLDLVSVESTPSVVQSSFGVVTFRGASILGGDPDNINAARAMQISSAIAGSWFGGVITPHYWDGLWIQQGLSGYIGKLAASAIVKEESGLEHIFAREISAALDFDENTAIEALQSNIANVGEATQEIALNKGTKAAALIGQLATQLGPIFQKGVQAFLKKFALKNVGGFDLWKQFETAAKKEKVKISSVKSMMRGWIRQRGYPLVEVDISDGDIVLTQSVYGATGDDDTLWSIPLSIQQEDKITRVVLEKQSIKLKKTTNKGVIIVNSDQASFVRVKYSPVILAKFMVQLDTLSASQQARLARDYISFEANQQVDFKQLAKMLAAISKAGNSSGASFLCDKLSWLYSGDKNNTAIISAYLKSLNMGDNWYYRGLSGDKEALDKNSERYAANAAPNTYRLQVFSKGTPAVKEMQNIFRGARSFTKKSAAISAITHARSKDAVIKALDQLVAEGQTDTLGGRFLEQTIYAGLQLHQTAVSQWVLSNYAKIFAVTGESLTTISIIQILGNSRDHKVGSKLRNLAKPKLGGETYINKACEVAAWASDRQYHYATRTKAVLKDLKQ